MKQSEPDIVLIGHNLRSCHNVGSILRTCDGLGINKFIATGTTPYPKLDNDSRLPHIAKRAHDQISKTALGAELTVKMDHDTIHEAVDKHRNADYAIYALEQSANSVPINRFKPAFPCVLIIGNEVSGVDNEILNLCDSILEIPMLGQKESFNVSVAAGIALWEIRSRNQS